ncbi:hypothetical protein OOT00_15285 [Desulfobotulus sp. H1]|uniref:Uncharacterized protein n=1 Tax=Desulfobotulus pelophilus TaxID=2823377 RepID=A0ABT3ND00_9BACT|nr:hypothetical protein [Desulfobotulus pelophilus]MCW7755346.1 hypothetical protein [Desulfobotulus pelophilus]
MICSDKIAIIDLKYMSGNCSLSKICTKQYNSFQKRMIGKYAGEGKVFKGQIESAVIDVSMFSFENYILQAKKIHKGNALRDAKKSDKAGYYCKQFVWKNHIPDIVEINRSKALRSGGLMKDAYNRSIEDMGGYPVVYSELKEPDCIMHTTYNWGIFKKIPGYKQGSVETNEKLLAYIKLKRNGDLATYTSILGHGDYLKEGIMYNLHLNIMRWVQAKKEDPEPFKYILYGSINSGNDGLKQWKKRMLFEGRYIVICAEGVQNSASAL